MNKASEEKKTILYARLSQDDGRLGESNSIRNQQLYLEKYAADNGFKDPLFFADDGWSGMNYNRPSWNEIFAMMEDDQVGNLIVKDASRLGREHIYTDWLTEIYFPSKGIRFLAPGNGADSQVKGSLDFLPIVNWVNEQHAKDCSNKGRQIKRTQAENGERIGGRPPYGYQKRDADHKDLIPDEETAPIVRRIFELSASGKGLTQIADILTADKVLTPSHYYFRKHGKCSANFKMDEPYNWSPGTVSGILDNEVYLGNLRSLKTTTISYKDKTVVNVPEEEQVLVVGTHEPIISEELWEIVRSIRSHKRTRAKNEKEPNMFSGLVYCMDCGHLMTIYGSQPKVYLKCGAYGKHGKEACTPHRMMEEELAAVVLYRLRRVTGFARSNPKEFADYIHKNDSKQLRKQMNALQKEISTMERRNVELDMLFQRLYEDHVRGIITERQFKSLSSRYDKEQEQIEQALPDKEAQLEKLKESASNVERFIQKAKSHSDIQELTPELLRLFIEKIEVGERLVKHAHNSPQEIRITYRDIGRMDEYTVDKKN